MHAESSGEELVRRAIVGDDVALKVLLTESRHRLIHLVSLKIPLELSRVLDVDDIVQDAQVEVFQRIGSFVPRGPDSFFRWTAAIVVSRLRNALTRHRAAKRGGGIPIVGSIRRSPEESTIALLELLTGPTKTPSQSVARREALTAMQSAIQQMPEHYREAISLVHIEGHNSREVGERLGRTDRSVRGLCRRGLRLLRQHMENASQFLSSSG